MNNTLFSQIKFFLAVIAFRVGLLSASEKLGLIPVRVPVKTSSSYH
jgi:hypothetical protein